MIVYITSQASWNSIFLFAFRYHNTSTSIKYFLIQSFQFSHAVQFSSTQNVHFCIKFQKFVINTNTADLVTALTLSASDSNMRCLASACDWSKSTGEIHCWTSSRSIKPSWLRSRYFENCSRSDFTQSGSSGSFCGHMSPIHISHFFPFINNKRHEQKHSQQKTQIVVAATARQNKWSSGIFRNMRVKDV